MLIYNIVLGQYGDDNSYRNFNFPNLFNEYFHIIQANSILIMSNEGGMWGWDKFSFFKEGSSHPFVWETYFNTYQSNLK